MILERTKISIVYKLPNLFLFCCSVNPLSVDTNVHIRCADIRAGKTRVLLKKKTFFFFGGGVGFLLNF